MQTIEATALLRRVVEEIDAPLFTFDPDHVLRLMNAAGERLLQQPAARLLGKTASELELNACFEAPTRRWSRCLTPRPTRAGWCASVPSGRTACRTR